MNREDAVDNFADLATALPESEPSRRLLTTMAGVTLDIQPFIHVEVTEQVVLRLIDPDDLQRLNASVCHAKVALQGQRLLWQGRDICRCHTTNAPADR
jgi:hypothetical protein